MAMDIDSASIRSTISISASVAGEGDLAGSSIPADHTTSYTYTDGTGVGKAQRFFQDIRTIAASTSEDLDLAGSLTGWDGTTLTFTKLKVLKVENLSQTDDLIAGHATATAAEIQVGGTVANQITGIFADNSDAIKLGAGSAAGEGDVLHLERRAGVTITAGTGDLLRITNNTASQCLYKITILGE